MNLLTHKLSIYLILPVSICVIVVLLNSLSFPVQAVSYHSHYSLPGISSYHLESFPELQYKNIVKVKYDVSGGSSALATILKYFYGQDAAEDDIYSQIKNIKGEEDRVSMLHLKEAAEKLGYTGHGLRGSIEVFKQYKGPFIVLIQEDDLSHFVIVKGFEANKVLIADPVVGNRQINEEIFIQQWNSIFLFIEGPGNMINSNFFNDYHVTAVLPEMDYLARFFNMGLESPFGAQEF